MSHGFQGMLFCQHCFNIHSHYYFLELLESYMDLEICVIPMSLKLISSHDTGGGCYASFFRQDGKLLIGCHDGIRIYSDDYNQPDQTLKSADVTSIACLDGYSGYIFITHQKENRKVRIATLDFKNWESVFEFDWPGETAAFITASTKFSVACAKHSLVAYNLTAKVKVTKYLSFQPMRVRFDSEENLYITSCDTLYKYSMDKSGALTQLWACEDIPEPGGIAFTKYGDIAVQSTKSKSTGIYIISPKGSPFVVFCIGGRCYIGWFQTSLSAQTVFGSCL